MHCPRQLSTKVRSGRRICHVVVGQLLAGTHVQRFEIGRLQPYTIAGAALVRILGEELAAPSANPLVSARRERIDSQAGFMSPRLSIAKSALVKTSWFGLDPNWGRVIAAAGYSGAEIDDQKAQIYYGDVCAYDRGRVADAARLAELQAVMRARAFDVTVALNLGDGADTVYTCDFSYDYVKINAEYTT